MMSLRAVVLASGAVSSTHLSQPPVDGTSKRASNSPVGEPDLTSSAPPTPPLATRTVARVDWVRLIV